MVLSLRSNKCTSKCGDSFLKKRVKAPSNIQGLKLKEELFDGVRLRGKRGDIEHAGPIAVPDLGLLEVFFLV